MPSKPKASCISAHSKCDSGKLVVPPTHRPRPVTTPSYNWAACACEPEGKGWFTFLVGEVFLLPALGLEVGELRPDTLAWAISWATRLCIAGPRAEPNPTKKSQYPSGRTTTSSKPGVEPTPWRRRSTHTLDGIRSSWATTATSPASKSITSMRRISGKAVVVAMARALVSPLRSIQSTCESGVNAPR